MLGFLHPPSGKKLSSSVFNFVLLPYLLLVSCSLGFNKVLNLQIAPSGYSFLFLEENTQHTSPLSGFASGFVCFHNPLSSSNLAFLLIYDDFFTFWSCMGMEFCQLCLWNIWGNHTLSSLIGRCDRWPGPSDVTGQWSPRDACVVRVHGFA